MIRTRRLVAAVGTAALGAALLAGCSSSSTTAETSTAAATSAAADGQQALPPVMIAPDATEATAKVGDFLYFETPDSKLAGTTIATDNADLVEVTQGGERDGATFVPGGKVLAPGTAVIVVTNPDGSTRTVTLTITE